MDNETLHRITFYIVDNDLDSDDIKDILHIAFDRHPVVKCESKEITNWDDDHILNKLSSGLDVYEKYFNEN